MKNRPRDPLTTPWLTTAGAAAYVGASEKTILRAVAAGKLQHGRLGGNLRLRFRREWLDRWLMGEPPDSASDGRKLAEAHSTGADSTLSATPRAVGAENVKVQ